MKDTELKIRMDVLNYGCKTEWYDRDNVEIYEGEFPTMRIGGKRWLAAYFVEVTEWKYDPMRNFNPHYQTRKTLAGPFPTKELANRWMECAS